MYLQLLPPLLPLLPLLQFGETLQKVGQPGEHGVAVRVELGRGNDGVSVERNELIFNIDGNSCDESLLVFWPPRKSLCDEEGPIQLHHLVV